MKAGKKHADAEPGRRDFLKWTGAAVGGALVLGAAFSQRARHEIGPPAPPRRRRRHGHRTPKPESSAGPTLTKFVDRLRIPSVISPSGLLDGVPFYDVNMVPFRRKLHRDLPPTTLWGYNAPVSWPDLRSPQRPPHRRQMAKQFAGAS